MSATNNSGYVLLSTEVELYVEALQAFDIEEVSSNRWSTQREMLEKLNMQAVLSASSNETEYVKDAFLTFDKIPVLMHELMTVELWKTKIFPQLFKIGYEPKNTFVIYLILYHEATLVNLLETVLYHSEVCQALGDTIYDLIDYCYRKMANQIRLKTEDHSKRTIDTNTNEFLKELQEQNEKIDFDIFMKLFSILRYIIDNVSNDNLPLGVINRILNKHDFILILIQAMELSIWSKTDKDGKFYKYIDNKWKSVSLDERYQLSKVEGQIWISLYELLLSPKCISKYDYTDFKKNQILKIRPHINDVLIDQIPNLGALQRFLEQLAVTQPPPYKSDLIIEQVSEIYDNILLKYKGKWKDIAKTQANTVLNPSEKEIKEKAQRWTEAFNSEAIEQLIEDPAKCAECGQPAPKRCSRCQSEWYCRRECQVKNWPKHKKACDMICDAKAAASGVEKK